jgi:hypothetical protein
VPERVPTVEWQVAGACNYDCSYCIQSPRYRRGRPVREQVAGALDFFASLPGSWEIKCSGGEAFAHPLFMEQIVPGLMSRTPHRISILTNFSADTATLHRFAALTRGRLSIFSASFHIEHAQAAAFAAKLSWFSDLLDVGARVVVNQVVLPGRLEEAAACRAVFEDAGLRWFPQLYKRDGGVAEYDDEAGLRALIGDRPGPREANVAPSYLGKMCWAGVEYLVVDKDGEVWSCRTAKRHGQGRLGSAFAGTVSRLPAPAPCPYTICPCTVPANRGMIEGVLP